MKEKDEVREIRDRFTDRREEAERAQEQEQRSALKALGVLSAVLVVTVACGVLFSSCGSQGDTSAQAQSGGQMSSPEAAQHASVASTGGAQPPVQGGLSAADTAVREGLPPDLSVTVPDTLVSPGEVVEFTAEGTPDVAEIALSDGRDEPMPLVRDSGKDTWRAQYRVPLHPRHDRFGVSVTAKTDGNRWRRVWVFLRVSESDSTKAGVAETDKMDGDC